MKPKSEELAAAGAVVVAAGAGAAVGAVGEAAAVVGVAAAAAVVADVAVVDHAVAIADRAKRLKNSRNDGRDSKELRPFFLVRRHGFFDAQPFGCILCLPDSVATS